MTHRIVRAPALRAARAATTRTLRAADRRLMNPVLWVLSVALVFAFQALLIFTHDPWLDEYQAIQLAVQAPDVPTLLHWLRYEGHPPLWYLLLRGLSYLIDPLWALPTAAALCALAAQSAILFASPFTRAERLLIATSEFVLFEHLTVSRSLSLGAAALFAALALWRHRTVWLAIAILPMCDFLFGVVSLALVALKLRERTLWWPGVALWLVSGALSAWSVMPAPDAVPAILSRHVLDDLGFWIGTMGNLILPWQGMLIPRWNDFPLFIVASWGWAAFVWFAWVQTDRDRLHRAIAIALIALSLVFSLAVYRLSARHLMLIALMLIVLIGLRRWAGDRPRAGFRLWLAVAALCGVLTGALNLVWPFDRAPEVAARIEALGLTREHWVAYPESRAQGVSALTGIDFERLELGCVQSFVRWNYASKLDELDEVTAYLRQDARLHGRGYLLSDLKFEGVPADVLEPIAFFRRGYGGQHYYIYKIGRNLLKRQVSLPPCVPGRRPFSRL